MINYLSYLQKQLLYFLVESLKSESSVKNSQSLPPLTLAPMLICSRASMFCHTLVKGLNSGKILRTLRASGPEEGTQSSLWTAHSMSVVQKLQ